MSAPRPADLPTAADGGILAAITSDLSQGADLGLLLQRFLDPVVRLAGARAGAVRLLSEGGDALQIVGALGLQRLGCGHGVAVDSHCGACGQAASGQPLVWARDLADCSPRARDPSCAIWSNDRRPTMP